MGVIQYNSAELVTKDLPPNDPGRLKNDSNGSFIAISYEARKHGVKRGMRGHEARKLCPDLQLVQVPTRFGKANLEHYKACGTALATVLSSRSTATQKASVDEVYVDISKAAGEMLAAAEANGTFFTEVLPSLSDSHVAGDERDAGDASRLSRSDVRNGHTGSEQETFVAAEWFARPPESWLESERLLACGAVVAAELRAAVYNQLGFTVSAGIAHNKLLAKLCGGLHKPNQQVPWSPFFVVYVVCSERSFNRF
jgi:DNA polymerase eta